MTFRLQELPIVDILEYSPNIEKKLRLYRTSLIRRCVAEFKINIATGGTPFVAAAVKHNGLLNMIKKLRLEVGGGIQKFSYSGIDKYFQDLLELGIKPIVEPLTDIAANSNKTFKIWYIFDFATNRRQLSDFSGMLNAPANQQNDLYVEWGDANTLYANGTAPAEVTIDAEKTQVKVSYIRGFEDGIGQSQIDEVLSNLVDVREGVDEYDITKANTSFDDSIQRVRINPARALILSHMIFAKKNTKSGNPTFSNDVIDQMKFLNVLGGSETIIQNDWNHMWVANRPDFKLFEQPKGVLYLDWPDQRQGGLQNVDADDLEIRLLTPAPADGEKNAIRLWYRYLATR